MYECSNVQKFAKICKNVPIVHNTLRAEECAEGEVSFNSHYSQPLLFIHISFEDNAVYVILCFFVETKDGNFSYLQDSEIGNAGKLLHTIANNQRL